MPRQVSPAFATRRAGYFGIAVAAASWGSWSVFLRQASEAGPIAPALATFLVMATIALLLLPLALRETRTRPRRSAARWGLLGLFGVSDAINCGLYFAALQCTTVAVASLTHYLAPLLVALSAPFVLREPRKRGTLLACLLGLAGLLVLLAPWQTATTPGSWRGAGLGAASAIFYAAGVLFNKDLSRHFGAAELLVYHMPSALLALAIMVPSGGWSISPSGLAWLVAGAVGPGAAAGVLLVRSLRHVPAGRAAVLTFIEPLTALVVATLVWGESLGLHALAGGAGILAAGYLVVREDAPAPEEAALSKPLLMAQE